tara:strand:- start:437 stop:1825 length:1389 start_codon:yes stop_codon:yes gene_type:complete
MENNLLISRYPVYSTYGKMGLSKDDIDTDTIYTIQKRLSNMSSAEKLALNITDEKLSNVNLSQMLENGHIKLDYNNKSQPGKPSYNISMDLERDGIFSSIPNALNPDASFIPEKMPKMYNQLSLAASNEKEVIRGMEWGSNFIQRYQKKAIINDGTNTLFPQLSKGTTDIIANIAARGYVMGETALKEIGEFIFGEKEFTISDRQRILQQQIGQQIALENAMEDKQRNIAGQYLKGNLVMNDNGDVIRSENPLFDVIAKNEGFEPKVYLDTSGIQTIGHGLALDVKTDNGIVPHTELINALIAKGYDIKKIRNGEESISMKDSVDLVLDVGVKTANDRVLKHYGKELMGKGNGFLRMALTDMMYQTGDGKKSFAGPKSKFHKYLNLYKQTKDAKYLGEWGVANPETVLGQMFIDAEAYKKRNQGGIYNRLERNAQFIMMWAEGRDIQVDTEFPENENPYPMA